ncbi:MAG: hypothetical protein SFY81_04830 [Verrucomicrobiota bacterium]|nr:hypothetical protein [Verrucomicrobiota bacterium]
MDQPEYNPAATGKIRREIHDRVADRIRTEQQQRRSRASARRTDATVAMMLHATNRAFTPPENRQLHPAAAVIGNAE